MFKKREKLIISIICPPLCQLQSAPAANMDGYVIQFQYMFFFRFLCLDSLGLWQLTGCCLLASQSGGGWGGEERDLRIFCEKKKWLFHVTHTRHSYTVYGGVHVWTCIFHSTICVHVMIRAIRRFDYGGKCAMSPTARRPHLSHSHTHTHTLITNI